MGERIHCTTKNIHVRISFRSHDLSDIRVRIPESAGCAERRSQIVRVLTSYIASEHWDQIASSTRNEMNRYLYALSPLRGILIKRFAVSTRQPIKINIDSFQFSFILNYCCSGFIAQGFIFWLVWSCPQSSILKFYRISTNSFVNYQYGRVFLQ